MFYRLFNILYKLTSRRGLKVFALTCVIIFFISFVIGVNQSHAMSTEDLQTYGSTLTYWTNSYSNERGNYLFYEHDNSTQSASSNLYKIKYYTGSDRKTNVLVKLSPGYIYAIYDTNPNSASNYVYSGYYFFLDSIDDLPMASNEPAITTLGYQLTLFKTSYTYIMGADKWLLFIPNGNATNVQPTILQSKYPVMQTGGSSGGGGSSIDYSSYLQDTIQELQDLNATATLIANDTADINTNVASILSLLQSSSSSDITTAITNQTTQQQNNYNSFTNTSSYDNSVVNIDSTDYAVTDSQRC